LDEALSKNIFMYAYLEEQGYFGVKEISGRGICGLMRFAFTVGLCYGLDETGYVGRYCYSELLDAKTALRDWDGIGDPPGPWIKHKGYVEYSNPNKENQ
jgi:hypothetical protein